jgi:hypothetical protein
MMNIRATLQRNNDDVPAGFGIESTFDEVFRGVQRLEWQPQHIVFHFKDDNFIAVRADRVLEMITYEE